MNELSESVSACCDAFRLGREAEASALFDQLLAELSARIENNPHLMSTALQQSLSVALGCQQNRDWIGLADEVEFSIAVQLDL